MLFALLAAAAVVAQATWPTYADANFGFSVETPLAPRIFFAPGPDPAGPPDAVTGAVDLGARGRLGFMVLKTADQPDAGDPKKMLATQVMNMAADDDVTVDKETPLTLDGAPALDAVMHTPVKAIRVRAVAHGPTLVLMMAVGPAASGAPVEFERMEGSLKFVK